LLALCLAITTFFAPVADAQAAEGYSAEARCVVTKAYGTAHGYRSGREAIAAAISNCTANGGIRA
jgi:hypothetical protein